MAFVFTKPVDPKTPIDDLDLPPDGWKEIDAHDYSKGLFGFGSSLFEECVAWGKRELKRHQAV